MYEIVGVFTYQEIIEKLTKRKSTVQLENFVGFEEVEWSVRTDSDRYELFKKEPKCKYCKVEGTTFRLEFQLNKQGERLYRRPHFNLYGYTKEGKAVMLTKDHILARVNGGSDTEDNYQVLCKVCNELKGELENPHRNGYREFELSNVGPKALKSLKMKLLGSPLAARIRLKSKLNSRIAMEYLRNAGFYVKRAKQRRIIYASVTLENINGNGCYNGRGSTN